MATTQYIGSRYVPVFADPIEWSNATAYEPLTIVTHEGNSYTSKQYVPTGIDIANTSYWALTGNYNAQIEQYRREVRDILPYDEAPTEGSTKGVTSDGIKKAIAAETTRATNAEKTNADTIANEVTRATTAEKVNADAIANEVTRAKATEQVNAAAIAAETTNRESADTAIRGQITEVSAKNSVMVVIGDSWSAPEDGYVKWHDKVAKNLGMTVDNFAVGGSGFVNNTGNTFSDQLDRIHTKYASNPGTIGKIYVQGIVNDLSNDATTLLNAYRAFNTKFASYFPGKGYEFVNASLFPTTTSDQFNTMNRLLADISLSNSCSLINAIGCVTPLNLQSDGRHPKNAGYNQLGNTVCGSNYLYQCDKSQYFTNGFNAPTYSDDVTVTNENFFATNKPIIWHIAFKVNSDDTSTINGFINWSDNALLNYFVRTGYTNRFPIYKSNGQYAGILSADSYTSYSAKFAAPVQKSDSLTVDLSLIFK